MQLVDEMLAGQRLALARVITKVESRGKDLPMIMERIFPRTGRAQILGITGPPGAGKSTLVDRITATYRAQGKTVAIVAIDPSSPFSGGAILGDRIRMQQHSSDPGVYIRSLGTRGKQGGLSHATKEVVMVLDAAGFDVILVETAGVGQTELDILQLAQTVIVILVPESGDSIQVMKAGLLEIADVFVVNKCDRPEADQMVRELNNMVAMTAPGPGVWSIPVKKTEANRNLGVDELITAVQGHQAFLQTSGLGHQKRLVLLQEEIAEILTEKLYRKLSEAFKTEEAQQVLSKTVKKEIDPYRAADIIFPV